jgi:ElaB/YqjD/DUF883 family membrane-anchored ribosome-binding protein
LSNPKETVVDELHKLIAEFEGMAKSALAAAGQQAGGVAEELSAGLKTARERLTEFEQDVGHELKHGAHAADRHVRERPWMAIGIAAAAAFLIGVAVARRD